MKIIKKLLWIFLIIFPFSNSFGSVTFNQTETFLNDEQNNINGLTFNDDGTKIFIITSDDGSEDFVSEYTLSTPYDISTRSYAGDSERCLLDAPDDANTDVAGTQGAGQGGDMTFSSDGLIMLTTNRGINNAATDFVLKFTLTTAYDVSTCSFDSVRYVDTDVLQDGTTAGDRGNSNKNHLKGIAIKPDGTKIFLSFNDKDSDKDSIKEYTLSTPFDLSTMALETTAIQLHESDNPEAIAFNNNGRRLFLAYKGGQRVVQYSLPTAYSLVGAVLDGTATPLNSSGNSFSLGALGFNGSGLKLYVSNFNANAIFEYDLICPFNIISGKCPSITENSDQTGMALAQIEIAKRTIDHATDGALNRLKWIRRNKDKQNLSNLNIDFNFTNQRLASLTEIVKTAAAKKKAKDKEKDVFYWSEGSIAVGRIGDTSISSTKKIGTDAITFGADKFTEDNGIKGLAFRVGRNNVDVGNSGSNLDTDTFNITYYSTTPIEDDTKFLDTFIGIGGLKSDLLTVLDGKNLTANRKGKQIYGTIRIKDEIKKDNLTFIPSGRFDIGHTILGSYNESGDGGIDVENQHIRTKKIRAGFAAVEDFLNEKYKLKRHGKIEYIMDLDRSSKFKYNYTSDSSVTFDDSLSSGALHSINGEIGIDIVLQDNFSIFFIYERNQALGSGHTDKIHIAVGYLPSKETNYAFNIKGSNDFRSEYILSKTINDFELDFKIINEDPFDISDIKQAFFNLRKVF